MNHSAPTWMMSFVPVILLTWFTLGWLLRGQRFCPRWQCQCALVLVSVGVALLPLGDLPVGHWFAAFVPGLSLPTLALLIDGINRHAGGPDWLPANQRSTVFNFAVLAGLALYPSAMGRGRFDVYTLGWNFSPLTVAVGALSICLIWRGNRFHLVLVAALLAWQLGSMESRNLWDYLVDPILFLVSIAVLAGKLVRRKRLTVAPLVAGSPTGRGGQP
jgi:hypothetical protein